MTKIGINELTRNATKYARRVKKGDSFVVCRHSKPLFTISPLDTEDEAGWETVMDFTKIREGGVPARAVLEVLHRINA